MIKKLIASLISAVVVIAIVVAVIVLNNPKFLFKQSLKSAVNDFGKRSEISTLAQALEKGSIALDGKIVDEYDADNEVSFGGKFYFSTGNDPMDAAVYLENLYLNALADGEEAEFKADAYFSSEYMYVADCDLLDGTTYGLVRGDLADEFLDSEWIDELIEDEDLKDAVAELLEYVDREKDVELTKDFSKQVEKYTKTLEKLLTKYAEFDKETDEVNCGNGRVSCRVITMTVDESNVADMLMDLYDTIEKDDDLRDFVLDNAEELLGVLEYFLEAAGVYLDIDDVEDFYDDTLLDEDTWEDLADSIEDADFEICISVATGKVLPVLRQLAVTVEAKAGNQKNEAEFVLNFGKDGIKKTDYISAEVDGEELFEYEISENTKNMYQAAFSVPQYDSNKGRSVMTEVLTIEVNRAKDKFEIVMHDSSQDYWTGYVMEIEHVISGKFVEDGDTVKIELQSYEEIVDDEVESTQEFDITLTIDKKDKMPKLEKKSAVKSVFEMNMDDFEEIANNFEEEFGFLGFGAQEAPEDPFENGGDWPEYPYSEEDDWSW